MDRGPADPRLVAREALGDRVTRRRRFRSWLAGLAFVADIQRRAAVGASVQRSRLTPLGQFFGQLDALRETQERRA